MKYLPILALAALAASVPNAHASSGPIERFKGDPTSLLTPNLKFDHSRTFTPEIEHKVLSKVSTQDVKNYALVNRLFSEVVRDFRKRVPIKRVKSIFKPLGVGIKSMKSEIIQDLGKNAKPLGARPSIPLEVIIKHIGPNKVFSDPKMAEHLAKLSLQFPPGDARENVITNVIVAADPRSLFQLLRAVGRQSPINGEFFTENPIIDELFTQNAAQFSNGLEIDKTWDADLLEWLTTSFLIQLTHPAIRYSHDDISAILAQIAYSHSKLQQLSPKPSLNLDDFTEITQNMRDVLDSIRWYYSRLKIQPPLSILRQLEAGPLNTHPKPFDITIGFKAYLDLNPRPSIISLLMNLFSMINHHPQNNLNHAYHNFDFIIHKALIIAGVSTEDISWLMQEEVHWMSWGSEFISLSRAFKVMCGGQPYSPDYPDCSKSDYFKKAPDHGVMAWSIHFSLIQALIIAGRYASVKEWLSMLIKFNLVPANELGEVKRYLENIENTADDVNMVP